MSVGAKVALSSVGEAVQLRAVGIHGVDLVVDVSATREGYLAVLSGVRGRDGHAHGEARPEALPLLQVPPQRGLQAEPLRPKDVPARRRGGDNVGVRLRGLKDPGRIRAGIAR